MKKFKHIYFVPAFLAIFLFKLIPGTESNLGSFKKQSYELKTSLAPLFDFEDSDESQSKTRFSQQTLFSLSTPAFGNSGFATLNLNRDWKFSPSLNSSVKRALLEVFRL